MPDTKNTSFVGGTNHIPGNTSSPEIQELQGLFTTYRLYQKQKVQLKNRIHSLLKEHLYGFTQEAIFDLSSREQIRKLDAGSVMHFQINQLLHRLERDEGDVEALKTQVLVHAAPFMWEIELLTSMKGVEVLQKCPTQIPQRVS